MDKYDIIDATTDLSKLEDDYFNWCTLPFKRRMRANDNCMSIHGCTVPQYYDRLRDAIVKADVNGSCEAVKNSLEKIEVEGVNVKVLRSTVGSITESDIVLAKASNAIIIGFNVVPNSKTKEAAKRAIDILGDELNILFE